MYRILKSLLLGAQVGVSVKAETSASDGYDDVGSPALFDEDDVIASSTDEIQAHADAHEAVVKRQNYTVGCVVR
jgi:hypothetical protein